MMADRKILTAALTVGALVLSHASHAQDNGAMDGEFSVQRFEPVAGPRNYMAVAGARTDGELTWSVGLMFDYQRDPFVVTSCVSESDCSSASAQNTEDVAVVQDLLTWNIMGSFTPIPIVQIGLRVPVLFANGAGIDFDTGGEATEGLSGAGLGDLNLEGKFRVFGEPDDLIVLGAAADLSAPLGHATGEGNFIGNATPLTGAIRAIVDFKLDDLMAAANLRGVFKENATFGETTLGPEFLYGVGFAYQVHPMFRPLLEWRGSTRFSSANGTNSMEINGGIQITPLEGAMVITVAGGTGLMKGIGVPIARGIVGVSFAYDAEADTDGDGIPDSEDQCPTDPEDKDRVQDTDGCPEEDVDHDKIPDEVDGCPEEPETENGYKDDDGCPDNPIDTDGDGIWDDQDKCPNAAGGMRRPEHFGCPDTDQDGVPDHLDQCGDQKEDTDGHEDLDGCPDPDNDGDGVPDVSDECPDANETMNGVDDTDGCPDFGPDKDNDGLSDDVDSCPDAPENYNGNRDDDGCPDGGGSLADIDPQTIKLNVGLAFNGNEPNVADAKTKRALQAIASGLKNWAAISKVEVATGGADLAKANAVIAFLVSEGVKKERLVPKAGGDDVTFKVAESPPWTKQ